MTHGADIDGDIGAANDICPHADIVYHRRIDLQGRFRRGRSGQFVFVDGNQFHPHR